MRLTNRPQIQRVIRLQHSRNKIEPLRWHSQELNHLPILVHLYSPTKLIETSDRNDDAEGKFPEQIAKESTLHYVIELPVSDQRVGDPQIAGGVETQVVGYSWEVIDEDVVIACLFPFEVVSPNPEPSRLGDVDDGLVWGEFDAVGEVELSQQELCLFSFEIVWP